MCYLNYLKRISPYVITTYIFLGGREVEKVTKERTKVRRRKKCGIYKGGKPQKVLFLSGPAINIYKKILFP